MRRGRHHQHNPVPGAYFAEPVDHRYALQRPSAQCLRRHTADLFLRHSGIMLEFERRQLAALAPAQARKRHNRPDIETPFRNQRALRRCIERLGLNADCHTRFHLGPYPPVMGGKNAISDAPAMGVSGFTWRRSIAARTISGFSNAAA